MAGLALFLDSAGITQGVEQSIKALDALAAKAAQTENVLGGLGNQAQKAGESFGGSGGGGGGSAPSPAPAPSGGGAPRIPPPSSGGGGGGGGGTSLAGRISGVSGALSGLRSIANATSFQHLAFEAGKLYDDFQGLRQGVDGSTTAFGALKAVMKAHPIFVITTVISAAAGLMSVLGSTTKATVTEFDRLGQSMNRLRFDEEAAKLLGASVAGPQEARLRNILTGASSALEAQDFSVGAIGSASQQGNVQVLRFLASQGDQRALEYLQTGRFMSAPGRTEVRGGNPTYISPQYSTDPSGLTLTRDQARDFLRRSYDFERGRLEDIKVSEGMAGVSGTTAPTIYGPTGDEATTQMRGIAEEQARMIEDNARRAEEHMERMVGLGEMIGDSLGNAFADAILGASSLRQALAGVVQEFARFGLRSAFAGLGGSIFGGFGQTAAQGSFQGPPTATGAVPGPVN